MKFCIPNAYLYLHKKIRLCVYGKLCLHNYQLIFMPNNLRNNSESTKKRNYLYHNYLQPLTLFISILQYEQLTETWNMMDAQVRFASNSNTNLLLRFVEVLNKSTDAYGFIYVCYVSLLCVMRNCCSDWSS